MAAKALKLILYVLLYVCIPFGIAPLHADSPGAINYRILLANAEVSARYRANPSEVSKLQQMAKQIGIPEEDVQKDLARIRNIAAAAQANCSPDVNLSDRLPPVRDQASIGWCYANAAADLASFKLKRNISAPAVALSYNHSYRSQITDKPNVSNNFWSRETARQGGETDAALKAALADGFCPEEGLRSGDFGDDLGYADYVEAYKAIEQLEEKIDQSGFSLTPYLPGHIGVPDSAFLVACNSQYDLIKRLFPNVLPSDFLEILKESGPRDIIQRLGTKSCSANRIHPDRPFEVESYEIKHSVNMMSKLNEQLTQKNVVAVGYNSNALFSSEKTSDTFGLFADHASVIMGRKWDSHSQTCELLLRNSWGTSCAPYEETYKNKCKKGAVWLPADIISHALQSVTFLK